MEISNSSAWGVLLLVGVLSGLVGYSFANKAAQSPPRVNSLDSVIEQTKTEYEALMPSLTEEVQKILNELNQASKEDGKNVVLLYSKHTSTEEKTVDGVVKFLDTPVDQIVAELTTSKLTSGPVEIERSVSVSHPY